MRNLLVLSPPDLQREPDQEEQPDSNMPPKFKRHLNDDEVTGSIRSERVREHADGVTCGDSLGHLVLTPWRPPKFSRSGELSWETVNRVLTLVPLKKNI